MSKVKKLINSIKRDGVLLTTKKVFRALKYRILIRAHYIDIYKYVDLKKYSTIIVFENNFGWNKIMKQRPQQIAENLPDDTLMFYHSSEEKDFDKGKRVKKIKDNLVLIDLGYFREQLLAQLDFHTNKYLMVYSTDYIPFDRIVEYKKNGFSLIYEYVDDINEHLCGKDMFKLLSLRHKKIIGDNSNFVVCTASYLYKKVEDEKHKYIKLISNGVNYDHFKYNDYPVPEDLIDIKNDFKYLICYYGALASWFDYELIKKISKNKDYAIVLIGQDYDGTLEKSKILKIDNVFYLGKKDYNELPKYGCNMDIMIIPFILNDITIATNPVKAFEYMAMEKPIITTALPECKKYKSILYSNNDKEFLENLKDALNKLNNKKQKELLRKEAKENTWKQKALDLVDFVNISKYDEAENKLKEALNSSKYDHIIVWRSPFGWDVPLFQRPQHIANQLSKNKCLVFYEVTTKTDNVNTIEKQQDNLYKINFQDNYINELFDNLIKEVKKPKYLQIYSTNWSMDLEELNQYREKGYKILYEYIDDISPELAGTNEIPKNIIDKYNYAIDNKDVLIVTTAHELQQDIINKRGKENMAFSQNGVDYNFFKKIDNKYKFENDFNKVIKNGKINICYYGALASWFDYELIKKINNIGKYNIILFGIKYDNSYDKNKMNGFKNVHFFGAKDYKFLKNYASKMDILIIPFVINSITKATSPLKLFEYMALKKPIVTTAMNECKNYKSVLIGNDHDDFIKQLNKANKLRNDKKYLNLLDKEAKDNDWSNKALEIIKLMNKNEKTK